MKRFASVLIAAAFASAAMFAQAAEQLSDQERTDLRQRVQEMQNQRSRNPDFQPGQGRVQPEYATAKPAKRAVKSKRSATSHKKKTHHKTSHKKSRSVKDVPGAVVRK
jgi:hypothetical protein